MLLTWKDLVTTLLVTLIVGFSYLQVTGYQFPLISGYRWASVIVLILGIAMCIIGSPPNANYHNLWIFAASILGGLTVLFIAAGLILGAKSMFLAAVGLIIALWAMATLHHVIGG